MSFLEQDVVVDPDINDNVENIVDLKPRKSLSYKGEDTGDEIQYK